MAVIKACMLSALAAFVLMAVFLCVALKSGESRCADFGASLNKETHLLANGYCLVISGNDSAEELP